MVYSEFWFSVYLRSCICQKPIVNIARWISSGSLNMALAAISSSSITSTRSTRLYTAYSYEDSWCVPGEEEGGIVINLCSPTPAYIMTLGNWNGWGRLIWQEVWCSKIASKRKGANSLERRMGWKNVKLKKVTLNGLSPCCKAVWPKLPCVLSLCSEPVKYIVLDKFKKLHH